MKTFKIKSAFISIISFVLFMVSCTTDYDIELDSTYTRLSVWGELTNDTIQHKIYLYKSAPYLSQAAFEGISGAQVSITDGTNTFILSESDTLKGFYLTDANVYGEEGKTYTLNIENVDIDENGTKEKYWASSIMPVSNPVDSIQVLPVQYSQSFKAWEIKCFALDPKETNYYMFKAYNNDTLVTDSIQEWQYTDDALYNGNYTNGITCQVFTSFQEDQIIRTGDKITLEVCGITKEFYDFLYKTSMELMPSIPLFSGPHANISTNIQCNEQDKAIGFFAVYSAKRGSLIYK